MTDAPTPYTATPRQGAPSFVCPRCNAFAGQTWENLYANSTLAHDEPSRNTGNGRITAPDWMMSECYACKKSSVWRGNALIWPAPSTLPPAHPEMASEASELYDEARAVAGISRRAAAALARAALERLLRSIRPEFVGRLDDLIAHVTPDLSTSTARLLGALRHVGNKSLHVDDELDDFVALYLGQIDSGVIELLFAALNDVTEELVAKPAQADRFYAMLPEGVRGTIERKSERS